MRFISCEATNFASYDSVELDFKSGLTLVYGKTGSGKSTIPDLPCWIMFGVTAKDGSADDVRSWKNKDKPTVGVLTVELGNDECITIHRERGKSNDLYWFENKSPDDNQMLRGKDLTETQRLLEKRLGISADVYLSAAYFCEFSPTASFFLAKAKDRRALFENLASLDLPIQLVQKISQETKRTKEHFLEHNKRDAYITGTLAHLLNARESNILSSKNYATKLFDKLRDLRKKLETFQEEKANKIKETQEKVENFEEERAKKTDLIISRIENITQKISTSNFKETLVSLKTRASEVAKQTCKACGGPKAGEEYTALCSEIQALTTNINTNDRLLEDLKRLKDQLQTTQEVINPYLATLESVSHYNQNSYKEQIEELLKEQDPYAAQLIEIEQDIKKYTEEQEAVASKLKTMEHKLVSMTQLQDLSNSLRGELLKRSVSEIETKTNSYMEKYFDSEIKVAFALEGSDNLKIGIQKNGYECSYKQLSKGQRQLLKLCFSVTVMQATANKSGIHFDDIWMDEPTDGLDEDFKVKAFSLFEELAEQHNSVSIIEHSSELKAMFSNRILVTMVDDSSFFERAT